MLGIVPARGGSKGVRGKNLRPYRGKPLVLHALDTLALVPEITRVICSTDDATIAAVARIHGYEVIDRPAHLAGDEATIGQVAAHATNVLGWDGPVCVYQPTCPEVTAEQITLAYKTTGVDSVGFFTREPHLFWRGAEPLYEQRVNRQQSDGLLREVGVFLANRCPVSEDDPLVSDNHGRVILDACDIDTISDYRATRERAEAGSIRFEIIANERVGSGHLRRCITLARELDHHHISFRATAGTDPWAIDEIAAAGYSLLSAVPVDVVVFDCLDTTAEQVARARAEGSRVVCLEDLGAGSAHADAVVNELYAGSPHPHALSGARYAVLRPEFLSAPPFPVRESADRVLVTFGGTDPGCMVERVTGALARSFEAFTVKAGDCMAEAMRAADLVVTSAGRTVHEAAALGVPTITIPVNERESRHVLCPGVLDVGLAATVSDGRIRSVVGNVLADSGLREEMSLTSRQAVDGRGAERIAHLIEGLVRGL